MNTWKNLQQQKHNRKKKKYKKKQCTRNKCTIKYVPISQGESCTTYLLFDEMTRPTFDICNIFRTNPSYGLTNVCSICISLVR